MQRSLTYLIFLFSFFIGLVACSKADPTSVEILSPCENEKILTHPCKVSGHGQMVTAVTVASNALRDPGSVIVPSFLNNISKQITVSDEVHSYAGNDLPTNDGHSYRDIPNVNFDDDGATGTNCQYALRPAEDCGKTQNTLDERIADCKVKAYACSFSSYETKEDCENDGGSWLPAHTWKGSEKCNGGQGNWVLVTRAGLNKEVWRDQRTGLIWSSIVHPTATPVNWCQASGNTQPSPLRYFDAYNNTSATAIIGNGTLSELEGGHLAIGNLTTTVTINYNTLSGTYSYSASGGECGNGGLPADRKWIGTLTEAVGSSVIYENTNRCRFKITQGSIPFADKDIFQIKNGLVSCHPATTGFQTGSCSVGTFTYKSSCESAGHVWISTAKSYCAEAQDLLTPNLDPGAVAGTYTAAKGGMGKNSSPSVRWRLPTLDDYRLADVNGIRFVLPDMGMPSANRPVKDGSPGGFQTNWEWTATHVSTGQTYALGLAYIYYSRMGLIKDVDDPDNPTYKNQLRFVRCVGR